ncbi:tetratricopeptide repeat protein [uncultured Bilophila sp.]|uniref:tetratricopeptide repeat protein n=1 Tax=uncultured Bilophila sp. TaxID=529385 RepID=UPI00280BDA24|nr:tetratricopeptide repeat protein [uncultured Bilophila sp.]
MADPLRPSGPQIPGSLMGEIQSEVAVEATPLLSFVLRNSRIIVACIVLLVLVIVGVGGWQWHQGRVEREAHLELGRILVSTQGPDRIAALETFLLTAPSDMKPGVQLEIATAALGLEQYGKAADAYAAVAAADPKGPIGTMAAINQADLLQRQGKYAEALAVFDSLEKGAPESLRPAILEGQAMSAELAGKLDRALAAYESIAASLGDAANNGYFQAKIAELKARMAS